MTRGWRLSTGRACTRGRRHYFEPLPPESPTITVSCSSTRERGSRTQRHQHDSPARRVGRGRLHAQQPKPDRHRASGASRGQLSGTGGGPASIPCLPASSRVDNQVEHFRHVWRLGDSAHPLFGRVAGYEPLFEKAFAETLGGNIAELAPRLGEYFDQVQVPHTADYAFGERLCFGPQASNDSLSIRGAYELSCLG